MYKRQEEDFKRILLATEMNSPDTLAAAITAALREERITPAPLYGCGVLKLSLIHSYADVAVSQ